MNKDQFLGKWKEFKGKVKEKWGKLTDDDISQINGKWDQLSGKLQQKYGWTKERVEREMDNWCSSCDHSCHKERNEEQKNFRGKEQGQERRYEGGEERKNSPNWHQHRENEKLGKDDHRDKKRKAG
ncbi:MAG: CsbD family protein [Silvanigrellaceae bacterium]|nr:CsbD family protein [Silvanigrellaceae bacterium]